MHRDNWKLWLPALLWTGLIILGSSNLIATGQTGGLLEGLLHALQLPLSTEDLELIHHLLRKLGHFSVYAVLAWLWDRVLRPAQPRWAYVRVFASCLVLASWDEWNQSLLSDRTGAPADVALDLCGSSLALALRAIRLKKGFKKRLRGSERTP